MFCAHSADTVDSIDDGTKNTKLIIFSTMSYRRRVGQAALGWLLPVINKNAICMKPS